MANTFQPGRNPAQARSAAKLRRILPVPAPPKVAGLLNFQPMPSPKRIPRPPRQRTSVTSAACEACRKRKSKCTGERPECRPCVKRGQQCDYATEPAETRAQAMRRQHGAFLKERSVYEELYGVLMDLSDIDAMHMLQRLRSGVKVETAVRQISDSDLLLNCSGSQASNSPPPTTTHRRGRRYSDPGPVVLG
ncbi:Oleate-activated transcription factor 1 like protein [Verticillium longisporum]|nr:Oleate-activated transcription factor 1 like protein [Verticillium longisporum]